jgi:hypothetical protein
MPGKSPAKPACPGDLSFVARGVKSFSTKPDQSFRVFRVFRGSPPTVHSPQSLHNASNDSLPFPHLLFPPHFPISAFSFPISPFTLSSPLPHFSFQLSNFPIYSFLPISPFQLSKFPHLLLRETLRSFFVDFLRVVV